MFQSAALVRCIIAIAAVMLTVWPHVLKPAPSFGNEALRDRFLQLRKENAPEPRILVVDIDEASTRQAGSWPWPRARIADLVETLLSHYGVRGIALDILLPEPKDAAGDRRLALLAGHAPLILAQALDFQPARPVPLREGELSSGVIGTAASFAGGPARASGYIGNHAALAAAGKAGNIGFIPDHDGVLRRIPLLTEFEGRVYPALALALVECCGGRSVQLPAAPGSVRIAYRRDWSAYTVASASEILDREYAPDEFRDRLVIIGSSSLGQGDRVATPLGSSRPGLGVQADVLSMLLDMQAGTLPRPWPGALIACAFAAGTALLTSLCLPRLPAIASVSLLAGLSVAWLFIAYRIFPHDPELVTTAPLATNLFLLACAVPYQWQLTQQRSRNLLNTLHQYVAPEVVRELLRLGLKDPLQPRQLEVTTLIADMENYTRQVESLPVAEAAELTRAFLECLTAPVVECKGTLDKYTGDGLVAFWGAPLPVDQHADLALDAAGAIIRRVALLSERRVKAGHAPLRVRIGIESGPAVAGDFGTAFRSIYTAVGDSVNTASRLEQAARDFPHDVIVGAGTVALARRHRFIMLGERLLRGKEKPTTLYALDIHPVAMNTPQQTTGNLA